MTPVDQPHLHLMGIRGVPARHGGFETFAARLAPWLVQQGWQVTVYCQEDELAPVRESTWQGVRLVHIGVGPDTALNSMRFDWACIAHAVRERASLVLTLGYNTALFGIRLRLAGIQHLINMDGLEWSREKWGPLARTWLYLNDWAACWTASHLLADHPQIARHLATRTGQHRISMIPYGTDPVQGRPAALLSQQGVSPGGYVTLIARPEPENSVLELVQAFSRKPRGLKLLVLGNYYPERVPYHAQVLAAASAEVIFAGGVYDPEQVAALREHALLYLHGHRVGGTNPSLLEAMGAGNAVLAHDNRFNRWVVGAGAWYFHGSDDAALALDRLLAEAGERQRLAAENRRRAAEVFAWPHVLADYEQLLQAWYLRAGNNRQAPLPPWAGGPHGNKANKGNHSMDKS
jgi:glycosyltransferase involved in cell wall biosynthesis